jgi:hypothetical protein
VQNQFCEKVASFLSTLLTVIHVLPWEAYINKQLLIADLQKGNIQKIHAMIP